MGRAVPAAVAACQGAPAGLRWLVQRGRRQHHLLRDTRPEHRRHLGAANRPRLPVRRQTAQDRHARAPVRRRRGRDAGVPGCDRPLGDRAVLWTQLPGSFSPADVDALGRFLRRLPTDRRRAVEVRHPEFFTDTRSTSLLEKTLADADAEWVPFDTTVFFQSPPTSEAEQEAWTKKPRLPRRTRALTDRPIVRYLGRDSVKETVEGWRPWTTVVADWLREGRSPTIFLHTPDNVDAPALARHFHTDVQALVPDLAPLPEPTPPEPATLF